MFMFGRKVVKEFQDEDISKMINVQQVQMKPSHNYADLKRRLSDIVGQLTEDKKQVKPEDIHLWRCSNKNALVQSLTDIN